MAREVGGLGKWGEDQAVGFLQRQGFEIWERNYNSTVGEIDIVAQKGGVYIS
jgi:putative endonuclease